MARFIRKHIRITTQQQAALKRLALAEGVSESEIIRRAIDHLAVAQNARPLKSDPEAWQRALAAMQAIQSQGPLPGEPRTWKREAAYEERLSRWDESRQH